MLNIVEGIVVAAKRNAAAPALVTGNRTVSFGDMVDTVARISNHFAARGLKQGTKVFINIADPDLRLIAMIAAMHAGLIPFALLEIGDLGGDVDHDVIVGAAVLQVPDLTPDLMIDPSVLSGRLSDGTLRAFPDPPPDALLFVGSTTGTTGRRKMVAETWGTWTRRSEARGLVPGVGFDRGPAMMRVVAGERVLATLGDVAYAGVLSALQALGAGAALVRPVRELPEMLKAINFAGVTRILTTPSTLADLIDGMERLGVRCPSVKSVLLIGALFPRGLVERTEHALPGVAIGVAYGSSEAGGIASAAVTSATFEEGYVGELFPGVKLITTGTRSEPATLAIVRDPGTLLPYYAAGKLLPNTDTFYTMPDLGFVEGNGVYLTGRDDEVYNFNGNKVAFSLIDADLRAAPEVKDVAVVSALPLGDALGLVIGVVGAGAATLPALRERVAKRMKGDPGEHLRLFRTEAIPRNTMGKIDRQAVLDAYKRAARN